MSAPQSGSGKVDVWKVADLLIKGVGAALITGAVAVSGQRLQQIETAKAQQMQRVTTLVDITSKQKELDVNLAVRMFETLLSDYLKPAGDADERSRLEGRLLLLRLVALNFQDVPINLKPLFKQFDEQLAGTPDLRDGLRAIAQEVARRQAFRMTFEEGFDSGEREVRPGDTLQFPQYGVEIGVGAIAPDGVKVTLRTPNGEIGPFTAGYFDSPLVDNVKSDAHHRVTVLLIDSTSGSARLRFVGFPSDLASDRFDVKEIARGLETRWTGSGGAAVRER